MAEIGSDSTRLKDRNTKFRLYEANGVKYYLLVDTDNQSIEIFELVDNAYKQNDGLNNFQLSTDCTIEINLHQLF
ncbi:MAG: Uma2 family endonuclease [Chitinophagaceae bacterium]|nr:Uma2 family endonuclease [Chitinophagaceae bacterium]